MLLYFYTFVFLCSCIFMLLFPVYLSLHAFSSLCFSPLCFFASIHTPLPQKNQYAFTPYAFISDCFSHPAHLCLYDFVLLHFCLPIPLSAYVFYLYDFISFCSYAFIILHLVYYVFRLLCIPSICSIFYIKTSLIFFYYMLTLRS